MEWHHEGILKNSEPSLTSESRKSGIFYGYVIVAASFFILAIMHGALHSFGVFLKPMSEEFGWTRAMTSGPFSLSIFLLGIFYVITGRLNDRIGPRLVVTVGGLLFGLGYLVFAKISALWQLYLVYGVLVAMGLSSGFVPVTSTATRWFIKRRGLLAGRIFDVTGSYYQAFILCAVLMFAGFLFILPLKHVRRKPSTGRVGYSLSGKEGVHV